MTPWPIGADAPGEPAGPAGTLGHSSEVAEQSLPSSMEPFQDRRVNPETTFDRSSGDAGGWLPSPRGPTQDGQPAAGPPAAAARGLGGYDPRAAFAALGLTPSDVSGENAAQGSTRAEIGWTAGGTTPAGPAAPTAAPTPSDPAGPAAPAGPAPTAAVASDLGAPAASALAESPTVATAALPQICFDFTKGACARGASCKYSHSLDHIIAVNSTEKGICFDYLKGLCGRGPLCRFSHDLSGLQHPQKPESGRRRHAPICYDFVKSQCTRGDDCRYSHDYTSALQGGRNAQAAAALAAAGVETGAPGTQAADAAALRAALFGAAGLAALGGSARAPSGASAQPFGLGQGHQGRGAHAPRARGPDAARDPGTVCVDFVRGRCRRGDACRYLHVLPSSRAGGKPGAPLLPHHAYVSGPDSAAAAWAASLAAAGLFPSGPGPIRLQQQQQQQQQRELVRQLASSGLFRGHDPAAQYVTQGYAYPPSANPQAAALLASLEAHAAASGVDPLAAAATAGGHAYRFSGQMPGAGLDPGLPQPRRQTDAAHRAAAAVAAETLASARQAYEEAAVVASRYTDGGLADDLQAGMGLELGLEGLAGDPVPILERLGRLGTFEGPQASGRDPQFQPLPARAYGFPYSLPVYPSSAREAATYPSSAREAATYPSTAREAATYPASAHEVSSYPVPASDMIAYPISAHEAVTYPSSARESAAPGAPAAGVVARSASSFEAVAYPSRIPSTPPARPVDHGTRGDRHARPESRSVATSPTANAADLGLAPRPASAGRLREVDLPEFRRAFAGAVAAARLEHERASRPHSRLGAEAGGPVDPLQAAGGARPAAQWREAAVKGVEARPRHPAAKQGLVASPRQLDTLAMDSPTIPAGWAPPSGAERAERAAGRARSGLSLPAGFLEVSGVGDVTEDVVGRGSTSQLPGLEYLASIWADDGAR